MKRTLAILLALVMVLSTVSFAAPVVVSTATSVEETDEQDYTVPEETAEVTNEAVDWIDDKYGHLVYKLDFETSNNFVMGKTNAQMYKHGVVNPKYETNTSWWINPSYFGTVKKETEGENSFLRLGNGNTINSATGQFMLESGLVATTGNLTTFTGENGYYTFFYDYRLNITGNAGANFTKITCQDMFRYHDGTKYLIVTKNAPDILGTNITNNQWYTSEHTQYLATNESYAIDSLSRYRPIFNYSKDPTTADADTFDIDNIKLYFKPFSVDVKVLGNENVQDLTVKIDIPADTLKSVYTKAELLGLVNAQSSVRYTDLTLEDGSSFEKIDIVEINKVKGVPKTYQVNHPDYGTLLYDIDFETDTEWVSGQSVSSQGFLNTAFEGSENWVVKVSLAAYAERKTLDGNTFFRMYNGTGRYPQFQVMSFDPYSGVYTQENGFYTVFADVRADISGTAGKTFDIFFTQNTFQKGSGTSNVDANKTNEAALTAGGFVNTQATIYSKDADALRRINYVFRYAGEPLTQSKVDTFDVDNLKLYFKPDKVTVKILGDESLSIPDRNVTVTVPDISYVVNKNDILSLIETAVNVRVADLTLADGTAFETVDLDDVKTLKAIYRKYDMYDDTYGHLLYNLDFETSVDYSANQLALLQGYVNPSFEGSGDWKVNGPNNNVTKVKDDNGNAFIRMKNATGQHNEFHVMSIDPYTGVFTKENGYYTVFADVRTDISGTAGIAFKNFWLQAGFQKDGTAVNPGVGDYKPTSEFTTAKIDLYYEGADALRRIKHIFTYNPSGATVAGVDTLDIDNLRLYFKPVSVDVTVLAGDNADFEAQTVTVAIDKDTLDSTITKAELMALVENDTDLVLSDLTLSDGSAFESIDVMKVNEVKAVWLSKVPESYNVSSMRIKDPAGIRFKASISQNYKTENAEYGFLVTRSVLLGEQDADTALRFGNEANLKFVPGVCYGYDAQAGKNVDRIFEIIDNDVYFTAAVHGVPATPEGYRDIIVVRPYYKDENGEYYYGAPVERSVVETAIAIRNSGYEGLDDYGVEYVQSVLEICGESI